MSFKQAQLPFFFFLLLLGAYLVFSLINLDRLPPVYEDEPFIASTGWKIATEGKFGTDLFTGFYGMENKVFLFLPGYPMMLGTMFHFFGVGLWQARLVSVLLGAITLILTYLLSSRLFHPTIGVLAIFFLLMVRLTGTNPSQLTGILFVDVARLVRYDLPVAVFGLFALNLYLSALKNERLPFYLFAGAFAGLASLCHLYGGFWVATLILLAFSENNRIQKSGSILAGFLLVCIPYIFYIASDISNWKAQTLQQVPRLDLLNWHWYLNNVLNEFHRYGPGLGTPGLGWVLRLGFWSTAVLGPLIAFHLFKESFGKNNGSTRIILIPALLFPLSFALFAQPKMANYLVAIYPVWAICWGWGVYKCCWPSQFSSKWSRYALIAFLLLLSAEGISRLVFIQAQSNQTTSYSNFIEKIQPFTPAHATILGPHNFWFGFETSPYRAWALPFFQTNLHSTSHPLTPEETLEAIAPDIILIDARTRAYLESPPTEFGPTNAFLAWIESKEYTLTTTLNDPTYGNVEIYTLPNNVSP